MASVAADTSAIASPPPLPSRSDAAPPAGPSGGFADLLDASAAPAPAPQSQGASAAPTGTGSPAAPSAGVAANGSPSPAGLGAAPPTKEAGGRKGTNDQAGGDTAGGSAVDVTVVAGLPVPSFAFASLPVTDQTPTASHDAQTASTDAAAPTQDDPAGPSDDRKDASAPTGPVAAGLVAALPSLVPIIAAAASDSSAPAGTDPVASSPREAPISATLFSAPSTDASTAGPDGTAADAPLPQLPVGAAPPSRAASSVPQDLLTAVPATASAPPPAGDLQADALPQLPLVAPSSGASDQNARPAPAVSIAAPNTPPGTLTPPAAVTPLTPPTAVTPLTAEIQVAGNAGSPREAEAIPIALPTQVATKFATPAHANDDATSDGGTDVLLGFAGANSGGRTSPGSNAQPGTAILPSFNPGPAIQPMPGPVTAPQHGAVMSDAVPLAGIPIAIVARAEAGERKFEIRLDPPDLGRIEVQLNVDSSGRATSHLVVDRPDTLDLLRRDAPALERALQSAGLTTDDGSLQFSLRDQSFAGRDQGAPTPMAPPAPTTVAENDGAPIDATLRRYSAPAGLGGGIDIRV